MIAYPISLPELERLIAASDGRWLADAKKRTDKFKKLKKYSERSGTWSRIKDVYIELQHWKCGYCERRLSAPRVGKVEHDVEHFRPKSSVRAWPPDGSPLLARLGVAAALGTGSTAGYYLLAYHPLNYCTACKTCNTALKSNYFPIAGTRRLTTAANPGTMDAEQALLIYPIGSIDVDPERLIDFIGVVPRPRRRRGTYEFRRSEVTIAFFDLDLREDLVIERAERIEALWMAMIIAKAGTASQKKTAREAIVRMMAKPSEHTNCVRSFYRLARANPREAEVLYDRIHALVEEQR